MPFTRFRTCFIFPGLLLSLFFLTAHTLAATFTVTNTNDSGAGSLRAQIAAAGAGDTINFAVTGTITLTSGEIIIPQPVTISGPGANVLAISGNNNSRVFSINSASVAVTITGLTITQGNGIGALNPGSGGGLRSIGPLTLINCIFVGNSATSGSGGVSLRAVDGMFINCTFSDNTAGNQGGAIGYQGDGGHTLTLVNCTITGNRANGTGAGGGILNLAGVDGGSSTLQVNNCTIANNTSVTANGGGIATVSQVNATSVATTILRSTIIANNTLPNLKAITIAPALSSVVISQGFNLTSDNGSGFLTQPTDILNTDPLLSALADNGGPTPTMALPLGSPALDKGNSFGLTTDQRGFLRTVNLPSVTNAAGGDGTDIGAFEYGDFIQQPINIGLSDQKVGSMLVFPYYTSNADGSADTRITISHVGNAAPSAQGSQSRNAVLHLFFIDKNTCTQADTFVSITPNGSLSFNTSEFDPLVTGYLIAVAVDPNTGCPIQQNVLTGNAFVKAPAGYIAIGAGAVTGNYSAESFWSGTTPAACNLSAATPVATLNFDGINGYDKIPGSFAVEIRNPLDAPGQTIVVAGLAGNIATGAASGAAQVGVGALYSADEKLGSFASLVSGGCLALGTIKSDNTSPRVPQGINALIPRGGYGTVKFNVTAGVGVLLTPQNASGYAGIRALHKTATGGQHFFTIPVFTPTL